MPHPTSPRGDTFRSEPSEAFRPRHGASLRFIENEGLLFDSASQKLYAANTTATFIWCCLEEGLTIEKIARQLAATFKMPSATASGYVAEAVGSWSRLGFVIGRSAPDLAITQNQPTCGFVSRLRTERAPPLAEGGFRPIAECRCQLLDVNFRIRIGSEDIRRNLEIYLSPLAAEPASEPAIVIDVVHDRGAYALIHHDRVIERWGAPNEIVPIIKLGLINLALGHSRDFGAVHAAAICRERNGPCVLMPGQSGAGKSTLTAALMADGFQALGDDTIVLARDTLHARPLPFGICLKDGAWELLASRFPQLADQPVHQRPDGKRVRYLVSTENRKIGASTGRHRVSWIVFPHRMGTEKADLIPLTRPDALSRLVAQFCPLGTGLDTHKVDRLIQWIGAVDCFELRFSNLEAGVERLKGLYT